MRLAGLAAITVLVAHATSADARPSVTVAPRTIRAGDPVLVTVTGVRRAPEGKAGGDALRFFRARGGYQAVFAVPLDREPGELPIEIEGVRRVPRIEVRERPISEARLAVEEEYANPPAEERAQIDADNAAIRDALRDAAGAPRFRGRFRAPSRGRTTSTFGEWRTFNDGHRSQHLGLDLAAREGAKVLVAGGGTVMLVRDTFLAGKVVVVAHGAGIATAYFHLSAAAVAVGDQVAGGELIGRAGQTGRTTGPHIHVSVWVPGGFVDPAPFFRLRLRPAAAR